MPGREREEIVGEARRERGRGESEGGAGWRVRRRGRRRLDTARPRRPACWACWTVRFQWVDEWIRWGSGAPSFLITPHWPLWSARPNGQWEPKMKRTLRRGEWLVIPLRGVFGVLSCLWPRRFICSEIPGAGKPRVGAAPPAELLERARCARAGICAPSLSVASHPCGFYLSVLSFGLKEQKKKNLAEDWVVHPVGISRAIITMCNLNSFPPYLLIHSALC